MTTYRLAEDIYSYGKDKTLYGKKGEKVKEISLHGDVVIVEGRERFSVVKDKLIKVG